MRLMDPEGNEVKALGDLVDFTGMDVLEIGCGDGRLTVRYAGGAGSVRAIDPDADQIARARATLPRPLRRRVRYDIGDVRTEPLPDATYDMAVLSYSL